jgi:hypothetical protein
MHAWARRTARQVKNVFDELREREQSAGELWATLRGACAARCGKEDKFIGRRNGPWPIARCQLGYDPNSVKSHWRRA